MKFVAFKNGNIILNLFRDHEKSTRSSGTVHDTISATYSQHILSFQINCLWSNCCKCLNTCSRTLNSGSGESLGFVLSFAGKDLFISLLKFQSFGILLVWFHYCTNRMLKAITIQHTATYWLFRSPILAHFQNIPRTPVLFLSSTFGNRDLM